MFHVYVNFFMYIKKCVVVIAFVYDAQPSIEIF